MTSSSFSIFIPAVIILLLGGVVLWGMARRFRRDLGMIKEEREQTTNTTFIISAFQDVTRQLKEKEKELERLKALAEQRAENVESYNENILHCVTSGVITFDTSCRITTINRAAEEILNIRRDRMLGRTCQDLFEEGEITSAVRAALDGRLPSARMEARLGDANSRVWIGYNTTILTDRHDKPIGVILSFSDLTEVKRLQEQMELRERLSALGEMSAGIAHELRNPMAVITGYLNLMSKKADQAGQDVIRKIADEISGMNRIIGDLLTFARPASLNRVPVNLKELIETSVATVMQATDADHRVATMIALDPGTVRIDEGLMRQALTNLIQNAVEAMTEGGTLSVSGSARQNEFIVAIKDTGSGIPQDRIKKIFLPFFTTKDKGVGMGLALAHKIISTHGGRIEVESTEGKGSTFTVTLPIT
jgi:two-component system, NtrC family, sensor histidine kinase AtoS